MHGRPVLDFLLAEIENNIGKLIFIFAGYNNEMEKFFEHNQGLASRVPHRFHFQDYEDKELLTLLETSFVKTYKGQMKVEDGIRGLYGRIAIRRLGRGRGRPGFGNARDVENLFTRMAERQAERLTRERMQGRLPDSMLMIASDIIGPDPSTVLKESKAWKALQGMIGLNAVKDTVDSLFQMVITNYQRELDEREPHGISLNRVSGTTSILRWN
jgi:hypothetical protein